ncbi:type II toxin-antitoxin system RelE/ParE family toxin [Mucilaginibacter corticis]|uniref:Type II toxin-antitoxin system RelE/ParE family toxin n=1 Tax=Mucilaginibacter corticis TaxID=2597670 RepID=A0A556MKE7_9SPHI|nr:type II toxin-antitoxin system RelE/ParE family toxin [Mucilaginibacter corticis]TSJ40342.1 type II toxin-antitoxin system RelE/ParE family toxin [Mucilaginibacter corticis]
MEYEIILHPEAEKEYLKACVWYEKKVVGLGHRFKNAVLEQLQLIKEKPEHYPVKKRNYRESNVDIFPYLVVYKVNKERGFIYIVSIFHTSKNPKKKYRT